MEREVAEAVVSDVCPLVVREEIVVVARYAYPELVTLVVDAFPTDKEPTVAEEEYKFVDDAFVATRFVVVAEVNVASVAVSVERVARVAESEEKNPVVVVLLEAVRLVMTALVVVALPTMRSVMEASVDQNVVAVNPLEEAFVKVRLVMMPLVTAKLVAVALRRTPSCV
jgi:hypothetical protein